MSKYFDKDFFKFLFGFMTIVCVSLIIILVAKVYSASTNPVQTQGDCGTKAVC